MQSLINFSACREGGSANNYNGWRHPRILAVTLAAFLCLGVMALATSQSAFADQVDTDLASRSNKIHWPTSLSPEQADLFSHNEIMIDAPCQTVWNHIVHARRWPQWYPNSHDVRISGGGSVLRASTQFGWKTFGVHIDSTVAEYSPETRLGWFGKGPDVTAYHTWLLTPSHGSCHVVTEEATKGPAAVAGRKSDPAVLHRGHELWITRLKKLSEG